MRRHAGDYAHRAAHRSPRQAWALVDDDDQIVCYHFGQRPRVALHAALGIGTDPEEFDRPWSPWERPWNLRRMRAIDACFPRQPSLGDELRAGVTFACDGCDHHINDEGCDCTRCDEDPDTIGPPVLRAGSLYCGAPCARENEG